MRAIGWKARDTVGFRFWKRLKIAPGVSLNLSKSGASVSLGPPGAKLTIGRRGIRRTFGIPGTGLYYTSVIGGQSASRASGRTTTKAGAPQQRVYALSTNAISQLAIPKEDKALIEGLVELDKGSEDSALPIFEANSALGEAAFCAALLLMKKGEHYRAATYLYQAASSPSLGERLARLGIGIEVSLAITEETTAVIHCDRQGALVALAECYQRLGYTRQAMECIELLRQSDPEDVLIRLSLAELLDTSAPTDRASAERIVELGSDVGNQTPAHAALLLYKGRALRRLGLLDAARDTLTYALRAKSGRPVELLSALRYERALVYEELGYKQRARKDLAMVYASQPDYEDVAERLGLRTST